ncbi:hypothetical protein NMG60_11015954, partial [Bertholletia excelsa]
MALRLLSALDIARTQYYHFKAIIIAGMGLFTDAYDLFCLPPIMTLIARVYYHDYEVPLRTSSAMVVVALFGTSIGQLVFGYLGDRFGRRRVYGLALLLMVASSVGCGFSLCKSKGCVLGSLVFFRFWLGMGIGGDYPLSATIMSEFANRRTRGAFIAAVFSMQGMGILAASTVTMAVCHLFYAKGVKNDKADLVWRIILMIGAIPAALTFYWRLKMPETARYTALVERNVQQAAINVESVLQVPLDQIGKDDDFSPNSSSSYRLFSKQFLRHHGRDLFSCATAWLLVDIVFYGANLVQYKVNDQYISNVKSDQSKVNPYKDAFNVAKLQALIALCSTIPGSWATVYFVDRIGRVKIQIIGFFFLSLTLFAMGIPYGYWSNSDNHKKGKLFVVLYGMVFFFCNFGPNTTTFIVPAELFPARFRSTCHGISGAVGKVGAMIGSLLFVCASNSYKNKKEDENKVKLMRATLVVMGVICLVGMMVTYLYTRETKGRSLEENENGDE